MSFRTVSEGPVLFDAGETGTMEWTKKKKTAAAVVGVLAAIYAGGTGYFSGHTYPNTTVDGQPAGNITDQQALDIVHQTALTGDITLKVQDKSYTLSVPEVLSVADDAAVLGTIHDRQPAAWPLKVFQQHEILSGRTLAFNQEAAEKSLKEQGLMDLDIAPVDSELSEFSNETGYTVTADKDGWKADRQALLDTIRKAAESEEKSVDLTENFAVKADIRQDNPELNETANNLNALVHHNLKIKVGDYEQVLNGDTLNLWRTETADGLPGIDADQLRTYSRVLQSNFSGALAELGKNSEYQYLVDPDLFLEILTDRLGLAMPAEETEKEKKAREKAGEPAPEQIAILRSMAFDRTMAQAAEAGEATAANAGSKASDAKAGDKADAKKDAKASDKKKGKTSDKKGGNEADAGEAEEPFDSRSALLTDGLYIINLESDEVIDERMEKASKQLPPGTGSNASAPAEGAEELPAADTRTTELVTLPEDEIQVPLVEADKRFQIGYGLDYIDVSIEDQHVMVFENGRLVMETACVTGTPIPSRTTHKGVFSIDYKQRDRVLTGSQNLYHTLVHYWMPFDGGIGLHDAYWRGSFGGTIYQYNGSHGCVNLPPTFAKNLYARCYPGETVYVH